MNNREMPKKNSEEPFSNIKKKVIAPKLNYNSEVNGIKRNSYISLKNIVASIFLVAILGIVLVVSNSYINSDSKETTDVTKKEYIEGLGQSSSCRAYQGMVKWNNTTYVETLEKINDIEQHFATITSYSPRLEEEKDNNFSNIYPVGTELYKIKNIDIREAIAVKMGNEYMKLEKSK